jgi:hypothetical protein
MMKTFTYPQFQAILNSHMTYSAEGYHREVFLVPRDSDDSFESAFSASK